MENILDSVKKLLGIEPEYKHFDPEIIMHINTAFLSLNQLGVGPEEGFSITDNTTTLKEFVGDRVDLEAVKSYLYLKVRLLFDPPQMGYLVEAINKQITELEWRLNVQVEKEELEMALRRKSISEMSNAELKRYVERMNLETRYKKIESNNISKGGT